MSDALQKFDEGLALIRDDYETTFAQAPDEPTLRAVAAKLIGPSGTLTQLLKLMPEVPGAQRKDCGKKANEVKRAIEGAFDLRLKSIENERKQADLAGPTIDFTMPGRKSMHGKLHPIRRTIDDLLDVFASMGFEVAESREIESPIFNFEKLGFPPDHPATDMQDSFFVEGLRYQSQPLLLRTHTTGIQAHEMLRRKPPMAVVCAGAVYRRDDDATHSPMFHQIDGFVVNKDCNFGHLKGVLDTFVERMFGKDVPTRLRPSYFPFVEPGAELDIGCSFCKPWEGNVERTAACRVCKATGWLEVLGCGMIHPTVFEQCGVDPNEYRGFAWGMGIDRIAMLRHDVSNIRLLYENDVRFLEQL